MEEIKKDTLEILGVTPELEVTMLKLPSIEFDEEEICCKGQKLYKPIPGSTRWVPFTVQYDIYDNDHSLDGLFNWFAILYDGSSEGGFRQKVTDDKTKTCILRLSNGQVWKIEKIYPQEIDWGGLPYFPPVEIGFTFAYSKATVDYSNATKDCCSNSCKPKPLKNRKLSLNWGK
jgi:hypothetical protein|tara:strand:- start:185 stop:706 length:522 start_codon:yes stop_codon:yes gene_type:complete